MQTNKLFIPEKCKAGFNLRSDTYSGKLAYVIAFNGKKWRKENSWKSWSQFPGDSKRIWNYETKQYSEEVWGDEVAPLEFDNVPMEGFVLNKKVGGHSSGWNHRSTYARVFDPRGFEFEITVPNLLFILQENDCMRGKGLVGEFVYSWDGKDLVLLPCSSEDYKESNKFTKLQDKKVSAKELIEGATYINKNTNKTVYLGNLPYVKYAQKYSGLAERLKRNSKDSVVIKNDTKAHVFWNIDKKIHQFDVVAKLAGVVEESLHPELPDFKAAYFQKSNYSPTFRLIDKPASDKYSYDCGLYKIGDAIMFLYFGRYYYGNGNSDKPCEKAYKVEVTDDKIVFTIVTPPTFRRDKPTHQLLAIFNDNKETQIL